MASSFTGNNDLEKPGIGEQAGVWGGSLNTNFDKIDATMSRTITQSIVGGYALTTSQTAVATFDSAVLRLTGNISGSAVTSVEFPSGKSGIFLVDTRGVTFGNAKLVLHVNGETNGVTVTSVSDNFFHIYTTGSSVRSRATPANPFILDEIRMWAPAGGVVSANLPQGWYVCNGGNGTVDLRGRFVQMTSVHTSWQVTVTNRGGSKTTDINLGTITIAGSVGNTTLTLNQIPKHSHKMFADVVGTIAGTNATIGSNSFVTKEGNTGGGNDKGYALIETATSATLGKTDVQGGALPHSHSLAATASATGVSVSTMPPFYTLVFIQYKGT